MRPPQLNGGRLEPREGVEPTTYCLQNSCSAIELPRRRGAECTNSAAAEVLRSQARVDGSANGDEASRLREERPNHAGRHRAHQARQASMRSAAGSDAVVQGLAY